MANAKDITITREQIYSWIQQYKDPEDKEITDTIRAAIRLELMNLGYAEESVETAGDTMSVIDKILDDLSSYSV